VRRGERDAAGWRRPGYDAAIVFFFLVCLALIACGADAALAQGSPFGVGRPPAASPPPAADGVVGWMLAKQSQYFLQFRELIKSAKADGSAVWALLGVSFLYGIFHAAGPGHGKAVISSYLVANDETWRRGVVLSFASAVLQALVAVALVGIAAVLLGATAKVMSDAVHWIELVSYALIAALGARLLWTKGRAFLAALSPRMGTSALVPAAAGHHHHHEHHHNVEHPHHTHLHHHDDGHVHDEHCGHAHGPEPQMLGGSGGWQRGLSAIIAVGLRPCSGAILVLVFAFAQGLFWAGVAATFVMGLGTAITVTAIATLAVSAKGLAARLASNRSGAGTLALRGVEVAAAALVLAFGVLLLTGYMANERLFAM
jgi:ABC-type nickel/cobalt efflux system permease component RcnA